MLALGVLRRLHQHQRVAAPVRGEHDAKEARERDERPVRRSLSEIPGFSPDHSTVPGKLIASAMRPS